MEKTSTFFWLTEQAASGLIVLWPVSVSIFALFISSVLIARKRKNTPWRIVALWAVLLWIFPFLILLAGTLWAGAEKYPSPTEWHGYSIVAIAVVQVVFAAVAVFRVAEARLLMFTIGCSAVWFSFWCLFLAGMSIADDWI